MNASPPESKRADSPRLTSLDGLRGLAATAVMLGHLAAPPTTALAPRLASWTTYGQFGVELFFMISGFVIPMSLEGKCLRSFAWSRFIRLYPLFWVCVAFSWTVRTFLATTYEHITVARILANATMIPKQLMGIDSYIEGSYWTLELELYFYLTCAVCWFSLRRNPILAVLVCISLINVAIDATDAIALLPAYPRAAQSLFMRAYGWLFVQYAHLFLIGVATHFRKQLGVLLYIFLLALSALVGVYHNRFRHIGDMANAVMILATQALFLAAALPTTPTATSVLAASGGFASWILTPVRVFQNLLASSALRFLGRISYPLYLIHQGIGEAIVGRIHGPGLPIYCGIVGASAVSIIAASFLTLFIDEPLRRFLAKRPLPAANAPGR